MKQNELSEKSVKIMIKKIKIMLLITDLRLTLWAEAVLTATYFINKSLTRSLTSKMTSYKGFKKIRLFIYYIRMFSCVIYVKTLMQRIISDKMTLKNKKMRLIKYKLMNIYYLWNLITRLITLLKDVIFNEENLEVMKKEQ